MVRDDQIKKYGAHDGMFACVCYYLTLLWKEYFT